MPCEFVRPLVQSHLVEAFDLVEAFLLPRLSRVDLSLDLDSDHGEERLDRVRVLLRFEHGIEVVVGGKSLPDGHRAEVLIIRVVVMLGLHVRDSSNFGFGLKHKSRKVEISLSACKSTT